MGMSRASVDGTDGTPVIKQRDASEACLIEKPSDWDEDGRLLFHPIPREHEHDATPTFQALPIQKPPTTHAMVSLVTSHPSTPP